LSDWLATWNRQGIELSVYAFPNNLKKQKGMNLISKKQNQP